MEERFHVILYQSRFAGMETFCFLFCFQETVTRFLPICAIGQETGRSKGAVSNVCFLEGGFEFMSTQQLRRLKTKHDIKVAVVDYVQRVRPGTVRKGPLPAPRRHLKR